MKKFNLLLLSTMVAFGALFTSCSEDDKTDASVVITLDQTTVWTTGSAITGEIKSTNKLETVTLLLIDGASENTVSGWPITSFNELPILESNGTYSIRITGLNDGTYKLRATDKEGIEFSVQFIIGSGVAPTLFSEVSTLLNEVSIYSSSSDGATGKSAYSIKNNSANTPDLFDNSDTESSVDFLYWNNSGGDNTSAKALSIYAPNHSDLAAIVSGWPSSARNATTFAKSSTLDFDTATENDVLTASQNLSASIVSQLKDGDVVVFKTASTSTTPSKVGLFKVINITDGYSPTADYVKIQVRIQD